MSHMDKIFKDRLYNQESPLGAHTTFEAVMARRKGRSGGFWYAGKYAIAGAILVIAALIGFYAMPTGKSGSGKTSGKGTQISTAGNSGNNSLANGDQANANSANGQPTDLSEANAHAGSHVHENAEASAHHQGQPAHINRIEPLVKPHAGEVESHTTPYATGTLSMPAAAEIAAAARANAEIDAENQRTALQQAWERSVQENWQRDLGWMSESEFPAYRSEELKITNTEPVIARVNLWNNEFSPSSRNSKWFIELNTSTASRANNQNNPDGLNILGNHHFIQYQGLALYDLSSTLGKGLLGGVGLGFSQNEGSAYYINTEHKTVQNIDTTTVVIVQPGLPDQIITVYDTSMVNKTVIVQDKISYSTSKISLPIAMRWYFGTGRFIFRLGGSVAPGIMMSSRGTVFSKKEFSSADQMKSHAFSMDSRLSFGLQLALSNKLAIFAEPVLQYQFCGNRDWMPYNRMGYGFGVGLLIKP